ncbi:uncharacterized protein LOC135848792 [Planococcus citri]|uniref:uncharacterized protein LOC135848792 n=1 Tax=Planococcus citri TaxID=170843 RepID=UPI0031F90630
MKMLSRTINFPTQRRRYRYRQRRPSTSRNIASNSNKVTAAATYNKEVYVKSVTSYIQDKDITRAEIKPLVEEFRKLFLEHELKDRGQQEQGSSHSDVSEEALNVDSLNSSIQELEASIQKHTTLINLEEKKTLLSVVTEIFRTMYFTDNDRNRIAGHLQKLDESLIPKMRIELKSSNNECITNHQIHTV